MTKPVSRPQHLLHSTSGNLSLTSSGSGVGKHGKREAADPASSHLTGWGSGGSGQTWGTHTKLSHSRGEAGQGEAETEALGDTRRLPGGTMGKHAAHLHPPLIHLSSPPQIRGSVA